MEMKIAYICGPYRSDTLHGIVQNIRKAEKYSIKYWKLGYAVICPHKNTALFDGICNDRVWLDGDLEILKWCDVLVVIPGWENSLGSREEIQCAEDNNIHIIYEE